VTQAAWGVARRIANPLRLEQYRTNLRDGTPVLVRPIRPDDKDLVRRGFDRLSPASRYQRFLAPVDELTEAELKYLTEIDYLDHFAWAALRADRVDEGMGVARYIRLKDEPEIAEAAVTVVDEYQGRGLGTLLLALLGAAALAAGIRFFRAYVLAENVPMRDLLDSLGARTEFDSPGLVRFDVPLDPQLLPDSPAGRVLKAVARHLVGPIGFPL
jgi:RimJ/RimL family protein N-acetyltransferase